MNTVHPLVLVTGSSDGIGLETARQLARHGADVIIHGRSQDRVVAAQAAVAEFCGRPLPAPVLGDLSSIAGTHEGTDPQRFRQFIEQVTTRADLLFVIYPSLQMYFARLWEKSTDRSAFWTCILQLASKPQSSPTLQVPAMVVAAQSAVTFEDFRPLHLALQREESRGAHFRSDFPSTNDVHWKKSICFSNNDKH